ncbi:MAG: hypothetical protein PHF60_01660 [Candidatus ainarchaeum sp.]|nr:hypothetical protein [Candidatus ainarchaeum sp.]
MGILEDRGFVKRPGTSGAKKPPEKAPPRLPDVMVATEHSASVTATGAYAKDAEERVAFENAKHVIRSGTVFRISFGDVLTSRSPQEGNILTTESPSDCDHSEGYVWGLGKRPALARGKLSLAAANGEDVACEDSDIVYEQLRNASPELEYLSIPLEEGPYAEKDGKMAEFADAVFKDVTDGNLIAMIERLIDIRPFVDPSTEAAYPRLCRSGYNFTLAQDFMTSDELPTAGQILSDENRLYVESASGASRLKLAHPMESYLLAVSALRRRGLEAYPAHAVMPSSDYGELFYPLIAIVDLAKEVPLTTFDLFRSHPPMASVDIISDVAAQGVLHAMRAEARAKHLTVEMKLQSQEGKALSDDEILNQLERISRSLFECIKAWPGCHFISRAMTYLHQDLTGAFVSMDPNMAMADVMAPPVVVGPGMIRPRSFVEVTAERYMDHLQTLIGQKIERAEKIETGESE